MDIGMIGLGRRGANMAQRLIGGGPRVVGFDRDEATRQGLGSRGVEPAGSVEALVGPIGSGHFTKMVHNGVEYGMLQAYAEGFSILQHKQALELDLHQVAEVWRHGSVVRSWLLDLITRALEENPDLAGIAPFVADSGEGRWTVNEALDLEVPAPVITQALIQRLRSRDAESYSDRLVSAMRKAFGGHSVRNG